MENSLTSAQDVLTQHHHCGIQGEWHGGLQITWVAQPTSRVMGVDFFVEGLVVDHCLVSFGITTNTTQTSRRRWCAKSAANASSSRGCQDWGSGLGSAPAWQSAHFLA